MNQQEMNKIAAKAALKFVTADTIVGVGILSHLPKE